MRRTMLRSRPLLPPLRSATCPGSTRRATLHVVERFAIVTSVVLLAACGSGDATPDANPDDLDGDGVQNAQDNCPMRTNVDQHDEDADAVGDACDNCPTIKNVDQRDTSETAVNMQSPDGVGDACDLRPDR